VLIHFFNNEDVRYKIAALSWNQHSSGKGDLIYQVQVYSEYDKSSNSFDVFAKVCIGSGSYFHDLGKIGSARTRAELISSYGEIAWDDERVRIGGKAGEKATLRRAVLEKHR